MAPRVVLVGPPGAGKTTVAEVLAQRLDVTARDTDHDVEAMAGAPVSDIFVEHGEAEFRRLERLAVQQALRDHDGVLALGGGAVLDPSTRESLGGLPVVFLDVGIKDAASRIGLNRDRPLLLGNPRAQWKSMMDQRRPIYEAVATVHVVTDGRAPDDIADEIVQAVTR